MKNEIIQSALRNLKIKELNPMQKASLEQAAGRRYTVVTDRIGQDIGLSVAFASYPKTE